MICPSKSPVSTGYTTLHQLTLIHYVKSARNFGWSGAVFSSHCVTHPRKKEESLFQSEKSAQRIDGGWDEKSELGGFSPIIRGEGGNGKHRHLNWTCWSRELRRLMKISKRKYQSFHHGRVKLVGACIFKVGEQGSRSLKTQQIFFRFDRPIGRSRLNSRLFRGKGKILFLISALLYPFD